MVVQAWRNGVVKQLGSAPPSLQILDSISNRTTSSNPRGCVAWREKYLWYKDSQSQTKLPSQDKQLLAPTLLWGYLIQPVDLGLESWLLEAVLQPLFPQPQRYLGQLATFLCPSIFLSSCFKIAEGQTTKRKRNQSHIFNGPLFSVQHPGDRNGLKRG